MLVKALDVSTAHIHPNDIGILSEHGEDLFGLYAENDYGCLMTVVGETGESEDDFNERKEEFLELGLSELFINLYKFAMNNECYFLSLDCDAEIDPQIPISDLW